MADLATDFDLYFEFISTDLTANNLVRNAVLEVYATDAGRAMLDKGFAQGLIKLNADALVTNGTPSTRVLNIGARTIKDNESSDDPTVYIGSDGLFHAETLATTLAHELAHVINSATDGQGGAQSGRISARTDFIGGAVPIENAVWSAIDGKSIIHRLSYSVDKTRLSQTVQWQEKGVSLLLPGDKVEIAYGSPNNNNFNIAFSDDLKKNILLLGGTGDNTLVAGAGNDYVYGGDE